MSAPRRLLLLAAKLGRLPQTLAMQWAEIDSIPLGGHLRFPLRSFCPGEKMENETSEQGDILGENSALCLPHSHSTPSPTLSPFPTHKALFASLVFSSEGTSGSWINWQDGLICDSPARCLTAVGGGCQFCKDSSLCRICCCLAPQC